MSDDTIYRRTAINALDEYIEEYSYDLDENGYHNPKWCAMKEAKMTIQRLPSAERRGRWINGKCSVCGGHGPIWAVSKGYNKGSKHNIDCEEAYWVTYPEDYCSKGERKDG